MSAPQTKTTVHIACPWCRYDLFGLPAEGKVVRCPECGNRADLRLLRIPPRERAAKIRGMESLPSACSGFAFFAVIFALVGIRVLLDSSSDTVGKTLAGIALGFAASWALCARAYVRRYRFVVGATRLLITFHACLWLFVVGIALAWGGLCGVMSGGSPPAGLVAWVFGVAALILGGWLYKRARGILGNMHDQLAGRASA